MLNSLWLHYLVKNSLYSYYILVCLDLKNDRLWLPARHIQGIQDLNVSPNTISINLTWIKQISQGNYDILKALKCNRELVLNLSNSTDFKNFNFILQQKVLILKILGNCINIF